MKKKLGAKDILFPIPAALIVSGTFQDSNIATVAWIGIVGSNPHTVGISLKKNRYTLELIRKYKEYSVNIPTKDDYKKVDYCGLVSGYNMDKIKKINFTKLKSTIINTPIIKECPFNLECIMTNQLEIGKWVLILGEIVESYVDADKISDVKKEKVDISKVDPLVYCATIREYWCLDKKIGDGFSSGKKIDFE